MGQEIFVVGPAMAGCAGRYDTRRELLRAGGIVAAVMMRHGR
jgi:hypothetical protein